VESTTEVNGKQEEIHDLLFGKEFDWHEIITDLINTEQLNPWDIDLILLTNKYLEKMQELEEANYFVSSKVLLAAAFLLRIKSEILLNKYIKSIDEILFPELSTEKEQKEIEKIEIDDDIPDLLPKSPMPRFKKVTLHDLMESLNKAIITENRRIKKEITKSNVIRDTEFLLPKKRYHITDKINEIYEKIFKMIMDENTEEILFSKLASPDKEEKIICFLSLLHLENHRKVSLNQKEHFNIKRTIYGISKI